MCVCVRTHLRERDKKQTESKRKKPCIIFICLNDLFNPWSLPVSLSGSLYGVKQGFSKKKKKETALKYVELSERLYL